MTRQTTHTISTALHETRQQLAPLGKQVSLEARLLMAHVMGQDKEWTIAHPEAPMPEDLYQKLCALVQRRLKSEPLSKILGIREFWGLPFTISPHTLDPRPDSEVLVEAALGYIQQALPTPTQPLHFLDLGTGSGCLLLSLLHECPHGRGVGIDRSEDALEIAQLNAHTLGLQDRVTLLNGSWCAPLLNASKEVSHKFDVILSNPPYISDEEMSHLDLNVKDYDPHVALYGGQDGLDAYRALIPQAVQFLSPHGALILEIGQGQETSVRQILKDSGLTHIAHKKDLAGITRCLIGQH